MYLTPRLVINGNECTRRGSCTPIWFYHSLPYLTPVMLKPLVFLVWSTNTYHRRDLGRSRPSICFTNHYHRTGGEGGQGDDLGVAGRQHQVAGWCRVIRVDNVENRRNTLGGSHGAGRYRKDFSFLKRSVGMQTNVYGGKTGRAMIKYPHTKKNAQQCNSHAYPASRPSQTG